MSDEVIKTTPEGAEKYIAPSNEVLEPEEALQPSPDQDLVESHKEKTKGEMYVEQHFHPQEDLPEEMPDKIVQALKETGRNIQKANTVWRLTRNGLGDLLLPSSGWESHYDLFVKALDDGADPEESKTNMAHAFGNANTLLDIGIQHLIPAGLGDIDSLEPSESIGFLKNYIDSYPEVEAEYNRIIQQIEDKKASAKDESNKDRLNEIESKKYPALNEFQENPNDETQQKLVALFKEQEEIDGIPWYISLAHYNVIFSLGSDVHIDINLLNLTKVQKAIYNDTDDEISRKRQQWLFGNMIKGFCKFRKERVDGYLKEIKE